MYLRGLTSKQREDFQFGREGGNDGIRAILLRKGKEGMG